MRNQNITDMKSKIAYAGSVLMMISVLSFAQEVEYDDLYFRSKDRPVLTAEVASKELKRQATIQETSRKLESTATTINPTDSYSARNVNPEYLSQAKVDPNSPAEPAPYFTQDFSPVSVNSSLSNSVMTPTYASNCMSCWNSGWNNGFYPTYGFGMMSGFGSPYSGFYSPYSSPWGYDPYGYNNFYQPGWSWSIGMSMMWGSGFGMNPWSSPWGWNSGFYNYNPWYGYGYPTTVVVVDPNAGNIQYRKRVSRSSDVNNNVTFNNRNAVAQTGQVDTQGRVRGSSGRTNTTEAGYYQRGWRSNPDHISTTRSDWGSSGRSTSSNYSSNSGSRSSSWINNDSGNSRSSWSGGNSSFSSGGSRSSGGYSGGGSSGSSSSGGARRGRD